MTVLDARPEALDVKFRPGSTVTLNLAFPTDWLLTASYTATLNGTSLNVTENGDTLVIAASGAVTGPLNSQGALYPFVLHRTGGNDALVGTWRASTNASPSTTVNATVLVEDLDVAVTILGSGTGGGGGVVDSIVAGTGIDVDSTDPQNPIVSATGGGGGGTVDSVVEGHGIDVSSVDPANPVVAVDESELNIALMGGTMLDSQVPATIARDSEVTAAVAAETSRAQTAEGLLVPKTTTVNGHALSGNVTVTPSDVGIPSGSATGDIQAWDGTAWVAVTPEPVTASDITADTTGFDNASGDDVQEVLGEFDAAITAVASSGVPDGDKGDITVALGVWTADADAVVKMTGAQTIAGVKTFSSAPVVPDGSFAIAKTTGLQAALDAKLDDTQLDTDTALAANSDTRVASQKATKAYADAKVDASAYGSGWDASTKAPTQNGVYDALNGAGKGFVNHGSTASTARPVGFASVEWFGTVEPTNAINGDTWNNPT